jgi:hypothetical protein
VGPLRLLQVPKRRVQHLLVLGLLPQRGQVGLLQFFLGLATQFFLLVVPLDLSLLVL